MLLVMCPFKGPVSNCGDQATKPYWTGKSSFTPTKRRGGGGGDFSQVSQH